MDLSGNRITAEGLPGVWPRNVEVLEVSDNALAGVVDLTQFATLPRLRRLGLRGNGIRGVCVADGEALWPALECIDLEGNELREEEAVVSGLRIGRKWTTGEAVQGAVHIVSRGDMKEIRADRLAETRRESDRAKGGEEGASCYSCGTAFCGTVNAFHAWTASTWCTSRVPRSGLGAWEFGSDGPVVWMLECAAAEYRRFAGNAVRVPRRRGVGSCGRCRRCSWVVSATYDRGAGSTAAQGIGRRS